MPALPARGATIYLVVIVIATLYYLLYNHTKTPTATMARPTAPTFDYEAVTGIFAQSEPGTDAGSFDYMKDNFGILTRQYPTDEGEGDSRDPAQWQRLDRYVQSLNAQGASHGEQYKVIYVGRHGEGDHNVAEAKYGTQAWDDYWSKLDGDGTLFWDDAHLTEIGTQQALAAHAFFKHQFETAYMPAPERYYVSPLYRCLQTANFTYSGLDVPSTRPFRPMIKEKMREVMGEHTCDRRSSRTKIAAAFPDWEIEQGFTEQDELWQADHRETWAEHDKRTREMLDDVFASDTHVWLSFTSHSGAAASLLRVLGHREFRLPTGALLPVLVKATRRS